MAGKRHYLSNFTKALLFLSDGGYLESLAEQQHLVPGRYREPGQVATANTDCPKGTPRLPSRRLRTGTK